MMQPEGKSFPQIPADFPKGQITVENSYFSTFSTPFSTRVFHRDLGCGKGKRVYINHFDRKEQNSNFFDRRNFHHRENHCAKITPLTKGLEECCTNAEW
jgi:hypothetical protein